MEVSPKQTNANKSKRKQQIKNLKRKLRARQQRLQRQREELEDARQQLKLAQWQQKQLESEVKRLKAINNQMQLETTTHLKLESFYNEQGVRNHTFGARMIALCINLAKQMAFRAVPQALTTIFKALGLSVLVPSHDSIENWCKRVGLNQLQTLPEHYDDMLWIVDHSNQIGQEKLLIILGIRESQLPPAGETLTLDQLTVLAIIPGKNWKRDDVRNAYELVGKRCGIPKYVLCDGAVELRESVDVLEKAGESVVVLRDFKHVAANQLEKLLGQNDRFKAFTGQMGTTRSRIQQTELAHLNPPSLKTKARFMNIAPIVRWGMLVLFVLDHPDCQAAEGIDPDRLESRLGWVHEFRDELVAWNECIEVLSCSVEWINKQGLSRDSGKRFTAHLISELGNQHGAAAAELQTKLTGFVSQQALQLEPGDRSWLSSEAIESVFGLYKRREGQHSRSGFTGMIATIPTLLRQWSPAEVRQALQQTTTQAMRDWVTEKIGPTVTGRRANAYRDLKKHRVQKLKAA